MSRPLYIDKSFETTVDDLTTLDQCDDARTSLTGAIAALKTRLATEPDNHDVKTALSFRQLALQRVQEKRAALRRHDLIHIITTLDPDVVRQARSMMR